MSFRQKALNTSSSKSAFTRPGTAPARPPQSTAPATGVSFRRLSHHKKDQPPSANRQSAVRGSQLTAGELASIRECWEALVVCKYRSTVDTKDELLSLFQALNLNLLPEVEAQTLALFASSAFNSRLEFDDFVNIVGQCKAFHVSHIHHNPLLCDDLLDAFVALGGQWNTKGSLNNDKMRQTIKQYDLKIDFDRFLSTVDTDGDAQVDFDEFRLLVEDTGGELGGSVVASPKSPTIVTLGEDSSAAFSDVASGNFVAIAQPPQQPLPPKRRGVALPTQLNDQSNMTSETGGNVSPTKRVRQMFGGSVGDGGLSPSTSAAQSVQHMSTVTSKKMHSSTFTEQHPPSISVSTHHVSLAKSQGLGTSATSTKAPSSPTRPTDHLSKLAHKVACVVSRPSPATLPTSFGGAGAAVPRPMPVSSLYHELGKAIANVSDLASFRERCADMMRSAHRSGNDAQPTSEGSTRRQQDHGAADQLTSDISLALEVHRRRVRTDEFVDRMCAERKCKVPLVEERRAAIQLRLSLEKRDKKLRKRRADVKDRAIAHVQSAVPGLAAGATPNHTLGSSSPVDSFGKRRSTSVGSSSPRDLSVRSASIRRRSTASALQDPLPMDQDINEDDDGVASVYSTSSSQRSDDEKRVAFNFFNLLRSGKTTPVMDSMDPLGSEDIAASEAPPGAGADSALPQPPAASGATRRRSTHQPTINMHNALGASPMVKAMAKVKLRERLFLSAQPTMRLGGNSNQMRLERVRPNPEDDEAAKAKARAPQVPAAKLTPRMRARVAGLTLGEKKEVCRMDETGRERNELNAKLYECYHGRF